MGVLFWETWTYPNLLANIFAQYNISKLFTWKKGFFSKKKSTTLLVSWILKYHTDGLKSVDLHLLASQALGHCNPTTPHWRSLLYVNILLPCSHCSRARNLEFGFHECDRRSEGPPLSSCTEYQGNKGSLNEEHWPVLVYQLIPFIPSMPTSPRPWRDLFAQSLFISFPKPVHPRGEDLVQFCPQTSLTITWLIHVCSHYSCYCF